MGNIYLFVCHTLVVCVLVLLALRLGKGAICALLALFSVLMNLFVLKQITLFNLTITATDPLCIGYLLGLNLIQEYFGKPFAKKIVYTSFFIGIAFVVLALCHLLYQPSAFDTMAPHYKSILIFMPRIVLSSLTSFFIVQFLDMRFFTLLRQKTNGKWLSMRTTTSLILAETIDTALFSMMGLFGIVESILSIMLFSLLVKVAIIALTIPFAHYSKKVLANASL